MAGYFRSHWQAPLGACLAARSIVCFEKREVALTILQSLREALPSLPKKLTQAANHALDHPEQMALDSMRTTAGKVGVTSTTMLRLARQLGYAGYEDFRASFQTELVSGGFGVRAGALREPRPDAGSESICEQIVLAAEQNIRQLRADLNQSDLNEVAALLRTAPNVYLVGSGSLFWLASMMKNTGNMVLPNLRLVGAEYSVAAEAMGVLRPEDVVICFGMNPTAVRTVEAMRFARQRGAHTVAVTDRPSSPIAEGAKFLFFGETSSPHYYPSAVTLMLIMESILATVVAHGDGQELRHIREFEQTRKKSGRYLER